MKTIKEIWGEVQKFLGFSALWIGTFLGIMYYTGHMTFTLVGNNAIMVVIR